MVTKAAMANGDDEPDAKKPAPLKRQSQNTAPNIVEKTVTVWKEFRSFLGDVRGEMRKVVTPTRKEVETTTTVVIIAVILFGVYFFVVDAVFQYGLTSLLSKLGGLQ
jgi:preprotein translocase subunit SecE